MSDLTAPHVIDTDTLTGQLRAVRRAALGLGSNLGDRLEHLQAAVDSLTETPDLSVVAVSPVYASDPVGGPADSPEYLNAVIVAETALSPQVLLERAQAIEEGLGRERPERWAPRTIDIDLLVVGEQIVDEERLQLPHPRAAERAFVLAPWADVDPDAVLPGHGSVGDLLAATGTAGVRRTDSELVVH